MNNTRVTGNDPPWANVGNLEAGMPIGARRAELACFCDSGQNVGHPAAEPGKAQLTEWRPRPTAERGADSPSGPLYRRDGKRHDGWRQLSQLYFKRCSYRICPSNQ